VAGWQGNRVERVQKRGSDGSVQATWNINAESPAQIALTIGLALDSSGNIFVSELGGDRLRKLSATGETAHVIGEPRNAPGQFRRPNNVTVDRQATCTRSIGLTNASPPFRLTAICERCGAHSATCKVSPRTSTAMST
jgi:hypothetical protein